MTIDIIDQLFDCQSGNYGRKKQHMSRISQDVKICQGSSLQVVEAVGQGAYGVVCSAKARCFSHPKLGWANGSSTVKYDQVISVSLQEWDCDGLCTCYQNLSNNMFQGFGMKDDERWVCSHGSNMTESWNREHPTGWVERWHRSDQEDWAAQQHALVLLRTCITQHNAAPVCPRKVGKTSFHTFPYHGWESTVPMKVAYSRIFVQTDQSLSAAILQMFLYFLQIHRGVLGVPSTTSPLPSEHCGSWRSCDICGTKIWLTSGDIRWDGWVDPVGPGWGDEMRLKWPR